MLTMTASALTSQVCAAHADEFSMLRTKCTEGMPAVLGGQDLTDENIAKATADSHLALQSKPEFQPICGGSDKANRKRRQAFKAAVMSDAMGKFGQELSFMANRLANNIDSHKVIWTVVFGAALLVLGGPLALLISIIAICFEHFASQDVGWN